MIHIRDVQLSFGHPPLLDRISFEVEAGERICLVGRNGAGKSTLLKLISGDLQPDAGEIRRRDGLRVAQLAQDIPKHVDGTIHQLVAGGLGAAGELVDRYHRAAAAVAEGNLTWMDALERCQHELEAVGGWELNQKVETVLSRLELPPDTPVDSLSGGLKRRALLARALVSEPDLLLLDEPTNHLDIEAIEWLEGFLLGWGGTLLFITHDRAFLRRLATRILELDRGTVRSFPGDYDRYLERKEALLAEEARQQSEFDKKLAREEAWIREGIKARRTRNEGRVRALQRMRAERAARREQSGPARMSLQEGRRSGRIVADVEGIGFEYDGKPLIRDLTTTLLRGDKVGLIGPNGAGKTTLLKLLLGELEPTRGRMERGTNVQVAYFDQHRATLDEDRSVQDNVGEGRDAITVNGKERHVLSYLQDFLFAPARAREPVKNLSGGERNRLLLARLFAEPANVLVLDEPTNDLDTDTLELLESLLVGFEGTVLLVSHDREFLDRVVTSSLVFEGNGQVNEYVGGYSDWLRQRSHPAQPQDAGKRSPAPTRPADPKPRQQKLSYHEQRELKALPERIESLEARRDALHAQMAEPDFYLQDKAAIADVQRELAGLDAALEEAFQRWSELEGQRA